MSTTFACPKCKSDIEITEVMTNQLRERLRTELDAELAPERTRLTELSQALAGQKTAIEARSRDIDEQVRARMEGERDKLLQKARAEAADTFVVELKDRDEQLREFQAKLKGAQDRELAWRKKERELAEREAAVETEREQLQHQLCQQLVNERQSLIEEGRKKATDDLSGQVRERDEELTELRAKLTAASEQEPALRRRQREVAEREEAVRAEREQMQEQTRQQVAGERQKLIEEGRKKAADEHADQLRERNEELASLRGQVKAAHEHELALHKRERELEQRCEQMQLEVARTVDVERSKIREAARQQLDEEYQLRVRDRDQQIEGLRKQIGELKRRAEQGSQQAQGEVLELALEEMLREAFPTDRIAEVPKGIRGGDVLQRVLSPTGLDCGAILWDTKRTKNWSDSWLPKLRQDQRDAVGERVKRQNITRDFQAIRRRAGVPRCKFHDLRKSYCTNIAQRTPLHVVQQLAGHADIRTTQKHYLQVQPELVDAARRAIEEMLKCTA